ncbi:MAG: hypothetical protein JWM78_3879 [Verrucomicrobiaceae bacterium]|nr:hypothetical protein [Verrucomicrobiaceae bacterium]
MTSSDKPAPPVGDKQRLLQSSKALIFKWASVHFKSFLDKADEQLFRMADKSGTNQEQNRYLQSRQELQQQQRGLEKILLEHMRDAFDNFLHSHNTAQDVARADTELKLVDHDQLEQAIAISSMTRKANGDYSEALYALNQRLSALAGGHKINDLGNPVAPAVFSEALQGALGPFVLDTPSKLVIYKIFDNALMGKLDKLYHLLNHHLKTNGVLPHLRYQIHKDEPPQLPEELATHNSPETLSKQTDLMALIQQLQAALGVTRAPIFNPLPAQHIITELQPLQQKTAQTLTAAKTQEAVLETDYSAIHEEIERETQRAAPVDADVIEIVGLLFEYMLNDEQLPDSVKALLSYMHTPFLKVALMDKAFFNSPQHPARQLLNGLVAAGERWVDTESKHKSDVYQQMKAVVQRILDEFDNDLRLFSQLAFDFNHFLRQHARRVRLAEQRAQQAARGEDKLKEIRLRIENYLRQKLEGIHVPSDVNTLLFEPWANFLAFNLLRFGSNSEQWRAAARVVDDLLIYLHPQGIEPSRLLEIRDTLHESLNHGFQTVGYEAETGRQLIAALQKAHQERLSLKPTTQRAADIDAPLHAPASDSDGDPLIKKLEKVEFGTWFQFFTDRPRKEQVQAKLAWSNNRTQHYMFVNRLGQQTAVKTAIELAADIRAGRTKILQEQPSKPFFEKALERIVEQLRPGIKPRY